MAGPKGGPMRSWWSRIWRQPSALADEPEAAPGRHAEQQRRGFVLLRFVEDLERDYQRSLVRLNANGLRAAQVLGIAAIFAFIVVDHFSLRLSPTPVYQVLCLLSVPALLLPLLVSYRPQAAARHQRIAFVSALVLGLSVAWSIGYARQLRPDYPMQALLLVTAYLYFLSGLLWGRAVLCGALVWLAFCLPPLLDGSPAPPQLLYEAYYLLLANCIGVVGRYLAEYQDRRQFLMRLELRQLAEYDALTGLRNRRAFGHRAQMAWALAAREHKSVSLLLLDLDFLKRINDQYGHLTGDDCLREVAEALRGLTRRPMDVSSRFGGDEFVALWYDADPQWIEQLEQALRQQLALRQGLAAQVERLSVTGGGVRCWPNPRISLQDALAAADGQLYGGKERGRGVISWARLEESPGGPPQRAEAAVPVRLPI